eukprot:g72625.t1
MQLHKRYLNNVLVRRQTSSVTPQRFCSRCPKIQSVYVRPGTFLFCGDHESRKGWTVLSLAFLKESLRRVEKMERETCVVAA